jgi:hypothetical protein
MPRRNRNALRGGPLPKSPGSGTPGYAVELDLDHLLYLPPEAPERGDSRVPAATLRDGDRW